MMRAFSLFIFLYSGLSFSKCQINPKYQIVSLSGPISFLLQELDLLKSTNLKGISSFHQIKEKNLKKIGGGLFLSKNELKKLEFNTLFFDQSKELSKKLRKITYAKTIEIKTKKVDPFDLTKKSLAILSKYLKNCEKNITKVLTDNEKLLSQLKQKTWPKCLLFYLGEIKKNHNPSLLMINDGPMKFLLDNRLTTSYQSPLSYVSWSMKEMKKYQHCKKIGLKNSDSQCETVTIDDNHSNISCFGALTPGLTQIKLLKYLGEYI